MTTDAVGTHNDRDGNGIVKGLDWEDDGFDERIHILREHTLIGLRRVSVNALGDRVSGLGVGELEQVHIKVLELRFACSVVDKVHEDAGIRNGVDIFD